MKFLFAAFALALALANPISSHAVPSQRYKLKLMHFASVSAAASHSPKFVTYDFMAQIIELAFKDRGLSLREKDRLVNKNLNVAHFYEHMILYSEQAHSIIEKVLTEELPGSTIEERSHFLSTTLAEFMARQMSFMMDEMIPSITKNTTPISAENKGIILDLIKKRKSLYKESLREELLKALDI